VRSRMSNQAPRSVPYRPGRPSPVWRSQPWKGTTITSGRLQVVILGTLNTDISIIGVPSLPGPDEDTFGPRLRIAAGGKARNAAEMVARLLGTGSVAFVGRTVQDPFGLWQVPYDALRRAGVDTRFITVSSAGCESGAPAIALVAVDVDGRHSSTVNTDRGNSITAADVDAAHALFEQASACGGVVAMSP
jgi:sugar/nucleoside kinase (ribokinase family)